MPVRSELLIPLGPTARVDRVHPPLELLTGPQRVEAEATDYVAAVALQATMHSPVFPKLVRTLGKTQSLEDLTQRITSVHGVGVLNGIKEEVVRRYENPDPHNSVRFDVREAMLQWAKEVHGEVGVVGQTVDSLRLSVQRKHEPKAAFKPSQSGKPRGPGSHTRKTRGK